MLRASACRGGLSLSAKNRRTSSVIIAARLGVVVGARHDEELEALVGPDQRVGHAHRGGERGLVVAGAVHELEGPAQVARERGRFDPAPITARVGGEQAEVGLIAKGVLGEVAGGSGVAGDEIDRAR